MCMLIDMWLRDIYCIALINNHIVNNEYHFLEGVTVCILSKWRN